MTEIDNRNFDAIIVGSGLGGLSCGAYLAKKGWRVLVLEKNSFIGGYASSFCTNNFCFDTALHMIDGVGKGQSMYNFLELCGIADRINFVKLKHFARLIFPEHDLRFPSGDLDGLISLLIEEFPLDSNGIPIFFEKMVNIHDDIMRFLYSTSPMWIQLPIFPFQYRNLFGSMKKTVKNLLDKYLNDKKLKALLFANWGFYGLPPSKLNVKSVFGNIDFWMMGAYYPKGGSHVVPDAFVDIIRENKGSLLLDKEVTKIIIENKKAIGVTTAKGDTFFASNIISNVSALETFNSLVGRKELSSKFLRKMDNMELSCSIFNVYLGLDKDFKSEIEDPDDYEVLICETYDLEEDYKWMINGDFDKASFFVTLYSNVDDSLAKDGDFVAGIVQGHNFDHWKKYEVDYEDKNKLQYEAEKIRIAQILIERAEKVIPGLSKHIKVIKIGTPLSLKRCSGNNNGAIYGWAANVDQFTPMDRMTNIPVKNLHLSSAWTFPGGGQTATIAAGYRVAKKLAGK